MNRKSLFKLVAIFLCSLLFSFLLQRYFHVGLTQIQEFVTDAGVWAPLVYCLILFLGLSVPFNPISDSITVSIAALVFPPLVAILMTFIAHTAALTANYFVARTWGDDLLRRVLSKEELARIEKLGPRINPFWIFGFRFLLPLNAVGFDFISYAAGLSRMDFGRFYLASILPWTFLSIVFFTSSSLLRGINPALIFVPILLIIAIPATYLSIKNRSSIKNIAKEIWKS